MVEENLTSIETTLKNNDGFTNIVVKLYKLFHI